MVQLTHNQDLTRFNTFGLPAYAASFTVLHSESDLPEILALPEYNQDTVLWLGGGSNVLFMEDYPSLVVKIENKGINLEPLSDGLVRVTAAAGENWHEFVCHTIRQGLNGLENLSLIPGTVGASPVQNIGAYGVEVKDVIEKVRCFDLQTKQWVEFDNQACRFAYRDSLFKQEGKGRYVITSVSFLLNTSFQPILDYGDLRQVAESRANGQPLNAAIVSEAVCHIRSTKLPDPTKIGNAGSFYKNPIVSPEQAEILLEHHPNMPQYPYQGNVKLAAGWLIDYCGLKGFSIGQAAVHDKQALVLVNRGGATAADLAALSQHICQTVFTHFGVDLEPEPNRLPETI